MSNEKQAAIVGTGLVGMGWAIVFARAGWTVRLYDGAPGAAQRAADTAAQRIGDLDRFGLIEDPAAAIARISVAATLAEALDGVGYVQESVFEKLDAKRSIFGEIDAVIGAETLVGSSSSGIPASAYTDHVACRSRCLVAHPVNPPYLVPAVELVPAPWTTEATMAAVTGLMTEIGQTPIRLTREIEGFVLNRLQGVLLMEAWKLYEEGIASLEDIDRTVSGGLGPRWAFMGPFETIDLNAPGGIRDYAARLGPLYAGIAASRTRHEPWPDELAGKAEADRRLVLAADELGDRAAWRDRRLMALARWKQEQQD